MGYYRASGDPHLQTFIGQSMMLWGLVSITWLTLNIRQFITLQLPTDWEIIEINPIKKFRTLEQWFDFSSQNGSFEYSIEMDRNLKSNRIDTTIIAKQNGLEISTGISSLQIKPCQLSKSLLVI